MVDNGNGERKDRLDKNEFNELIPHLPLQDILLIEYCINKWSTMIESDFTNKIIKCNLCCVNEIGKKNVYSHIQGKRHNLNMQSVKQLYHPQYTYAKEHCAIIPDKKSTEKIQGSKVESTGIQHFPALQKVSEAKISTAIDQKKITTVDLKLKSQNSDNINKSVILTAVGHRQGVYMSTDVTDCNDISKKVDAQTEEASDTCIVKNPCALKSIAINNNSQSRIRILKYSPKKVANRNPSFEIIVIDDDNLAEDTLNGKDIEDISETQTKKTAEYMECSNSSEFDKSVEPLAKKKKIMSNVKSQKPPYINIIENEKNAKIFSYKPNTSLSKVRNSNRKIGFQQSLKDPQFSKKTFSTKLSDNVINGLLGVEYVVKIIQDRGNLSPRYECALCEIVLDGRAMQNHIAGYDHRLKFCEKHFPTAIHQYRQYIGNISKNEVHRVMSEILQNLAVAIESHHGRYLPHECSERNYNMNRNDVLSTLFSCRHASEQNGPTFTHVVDTKKIDEFISGNNSIKTHSAPEVSYFDTTASSIFGHNRSRSQQRHEHSRHQLDEAFSAIPSGNKYPLQNIKQHDSNYSDFVLDDNVTYSKNIQKSGIRFTKRPHSSDGQSEHERLLRQTRSRSHSWDRQRYNDRSRSPPYESSYNRDVIISKSPTCSGSKWRHIVNQGVDEINARFNAFKKNPESHPMYQEEWQKFWYRRRDELLSAGLDHHKYNFQVEWVQFFNNRIEELYKQAIEIVRSTSKEPDFLTLKNYDNGGCKQSVRVTNEGSTKNENREYIKRLDINSKLTLTEKSPDIISVLRLMTALEEHLGSLGPKIVYLLSTALQTEKLNPLEVYNTILTIDNCKLLETAMEKFKGLVIAGVLEGSKERALKRVIPDIESLIHYAKNFPKRNEPAQKLFVPALIEQAKNSATNKRFLYKSSTLDKQELAMQLGASLMAQGKTDFEPEHLEQLIAVYTLLEKKKRESSLFDADRRTQTSGEVLSDKLQNASSGSYSIGKIDCNRVSLGVHNLNQKQIGNNYDMMQPSRRVYPNGNINNNAQVNAWCERQIHQQPKSNRIPEKSNVGSPVNIFDSSRFDQTQNFIRNNFHRNSMPMGNHCLTGCNYFSNSNAYSMNSATGNFNNTLNFSSNNGEREQVQQHQVQQQQLQQINKSINRQGTVYNYIPNSNAHSKNSLNSKGNFKSTINFSNNSNNRQLQEINSSIYNNNNNGTHSWISNNQNQNWFSNQFPKQS